MQKEWIVENSDQEILSIKCPQQYENIAMEDIVVWVDPLDGTTEFTRVNILEKLFHNFQFIACRVLLSL